MGCNNLAHHQFAGLSLGDTREDSPLTTEGSTDVPNIGMGYGIALPPAASLSQALRDPGHDIREEYIDEIDSVGSFEFPVSRD